MKNDEFPFKANAPKKEFVQKCKKGGEHPSPIFSDEKTQFSSDFFFHS